MPQQESFDIVVIGGGINGCGIARDAAGRGLSVYLAEQDDLAQGTSSASTKLIHGGLRYLEHYEFRLVHQSLKEREILLRNAPHIIWPMRFILPHHSGLRPAWMLRLGLFLYDHLGARKLLPATRVLNLQQDPAGKPLQNQFQKAFEYSDCWVDDARLVALNAQDAAERGATIATHQQVIRALRGKTHWTIEILDKIKQTTIVIKAKALVNAAGPWVDKVIAGTQAADDDEIQTNVRLVRGSHIVVPRISGDERAYIFQNKDARILFAIPYEQHFTLIGTTDADHNTPLESVHATAAEITYLCNATAEYFQQAVEPQDVIWSYAGIRPLYDDGASAAQEATRDYVLKLNAAQNQPPLLNIFGGKITTYRRLANAALEKLSAYLPIPESDWTGNTPLPGGDFSLNEKAELVRSLQTRHPFLDLSTAQRLIRSYGKRAFQIFDQDTRDEKNPPQDFGAGLTAAEVSYMVTHEFARDLDDILWRRSKLGLHLDTAQQKALQAWLQQNKHKLINSTPADELIT